MQRGKEHTMNAHGMSVKALNLLVNIVLGTCVLALGLARLFDPHGLTDLIIASILLFLGLFAMWANSSRFNEHMDEMASYHDRWAASRALVVVYALVGVGCVLSMLAGVEWDLGGAGLIVMGIAMVVHGTTFALLEREDVYADYQDA